MAVILIKILYFGNNKEFANAVAYTYEYAKKNNELDDIQVVAKYSDTVEIIKELMNLGYDIASIIDMRSDYADEYIIKLTCNEIWCEPAKRECGYFSTFTYACFIMDYCNSKILKYIDSSLMFEASIDEDECSGDCENCSAHETEFSNDRQYVERYSVNGNEVDKATYDEVAEKFQNKYMESVADMLLSYCEFMDEIRKIG